MGLFFWCGFGFSVRARNDARVRHAAAQHLRPSFQMQEREEGRQKGQSAHNVGGVHRGVVSIRGLFSRAGYG